MSLKILLLSIFLFLFELALKLIGKNLQKSFLRKIQNGVFDDVRKDKYEKFVLKQNYYMPNIALLLLAASFIGFVYSINLISCKNDYTGILISSLGILLSLLLFIIYMSFIFVIDNDGVTSYKFFIKKHIDFFCIKEIKYSWSYGGSCLISDGKHKIYLSLELRGFNQFFQLLKSKTSEERCLAVSIELQRRKFKSDNNFFYS